MKGIKFAVILSCVLTLISFGFECYAANPLGNDGMDNTDKNKSVYISIENDSILENAILSFSELRENDGKKVITKIYTLPNGNIVKDVFTLSRYQLRSASGSDTATRTRTVSNWGSITITASFSWYTEGNFAYVKCTGMNASRVLSSDIVVNKWETSYTQDYISIGKAKAQVDYHFYQKSMPTQYIKGTFKITCSDNGTISDNG